MTAIVSPKPRRGSFNPPPALERPAPLLSPPIYPSSDLSRSAGLFGPPRLLSPINIASPGLPKANVSPSRPVATRRTLTHCLILPPQLSKSSGNCSSTKRRRIASSNTRTLRRRHCTRSDCISLTSSVFDQLPWIHQVESAPEHVDAWDIADLSLLPDALDLHSDSGVGPVRRRKTSLRSSQLESAAHHHHPSSQLSIPPPMFARMALDPRTPPPSGKFNPMEVNFVNLMPVLPSNCEDDDASPRFPTWTRPSTPTRM
ncbi:hypothetical protein BDW22DRAFT_252779 [Trametopsis cervina]|nr:hypothetical protein BDW22DRAFT_252779 [Trametopsis cervina]